MASLTDLEKRMVKILKEKIDDDHDFLLGAVSFCETDKCRQAIIDGVLNGKLKTSSDVLEMTN